ncbi:hypothetical protein H6P81_021732 [Aristolochia fimbriata]|uniref:Uncharacterized protein n=1 Tax=Aristolochia fimbriata TaxID=158543 RepID=A0AAV7DQR6_ARIFI|nr:hypothetical protein H6P81_021732 [Aristolochia fimbriata]
MDFMPVRQQGRLQTTLRTGESRRFSYLALPVRRHTRGILLVFPPDLVASKARPPGHRQPPAGVLLREPGPLTPLLSHAQGQGGRSHHLSGRRPWGKVFFSQPAKGKDDHVPLDDHHRTTAGGKEGTGGENTPGGRPGRDSAPHQVSIDFATLFIDERRAKISAVESWLGYPCSRSTASLPSSLWHAEERLFVFAPTVTAGRRRPAGRRVANAGGLGIRRAPDSPPAAAGHRGAALLAWSRCFAESINDPSAGSPTKTFVIYSPSSK